MPSLFSIFHVSQTVNDNYNTYDSFVCVAESADRAQRMCPEPYADDLFYKWDDKGNLIVPDVLKEFPRCWATKLNDVTVKRVGSADEGPERMLVVSFNAA